MAAVRKLGDVAVRVAGAGPEASLLQDVIGLQAMGALSGDAVRDEMSRSVTLVLPSIWSENFPRTLVEAYGCICNMHSVVTAGQNKAFGRIVAMD